MTKQNVNRRSRVGTAWRNTLREVFQEVDAIALPVLRKAPLKRNLFLTGIFEARFLEDPEHRGSELCWRSRVGPADSAPGRKFSGDQHPAHRTTEKRSGPAKHRTPYRDEKLSEIAVGD